MTNARYLFLGVMLFLSSLLGAWSFAHNAASTESTDAQVNFTHFELQKGEKITLVEPFTSLFDLLQFKSESSQFQDYQGKKYSALDLFRPLNKLINAKSPLGPDALADEVLRRFDSHKSIIDEVLETASEFFKAMDSRGVKLLPLSQSEIMVEAGGAAVKMGGELIAAEYSKKIEAQLLQVYQQVYEKYKFADDFQSVEAVRQELYEKTLAALNNFMQSYYDPNEYIFKGMFLGTQAKGNLIKDFEGFSKKVLPPLIQENSHVKGIMGLVLHSPRLVTTLNAFDLQQVLNKKAVFTVTPSLWLSARVRTGQTSAAKLGKDSFSDSRVLPSADEPAVVGTNANTNVSIADSQYLTSGFIWGERDLDIASLESCEGVFIEMTGLFMGFAININQAFFFKEITQPRSPSASVLSFSIENHGWKKLRREEIKSALGKLKLIPNIGYIHAFPISKYSMDVSSF